MKYGKTARRIVTAAKVLKRTDPKSGAMLFRESYRYHPRTSIPREKNALAKLLPVVRYIDHTAYATELAIAKTKTNHKSDNGWFHGGRCT